MDKTHILVVEDSEITLFKLKAVLIRLGYTVTTSSAATEALKWLQETKERPRLIISDVVMPGMDGFEFARCGPCRRSLKSRSSCLPGKQI
jgi:CheY-like chemotaxis protein